jgi:predicted  nucleic acid-binding Zn-ribbon protein
VQNDFGFAFVGVLVGALITGVFSYLAQSKKSGTDREVAVLAEWSKLNEALSDRLAAVEKEFADYRNQVSAQFEDLRKTHGDEMDAMRNKHRAEMRRLRELNEGLQRMIAQNSQSTAHLISDSPATDSATREKD